MKKSHIIRNSHSICTIFAVFLALLMAAACLTSPAFAAESGQGGQIEQDDSGHNDCAHYTEEDQPTTPRINMIENNPDHDELNHKVWITDSEGNEVEDLQADQTYTVHYYIRVSGPEAAKGVCVRGYGDFMYLAPRQTHGTSRIGFELESENAGRDCGYVEAYTSGDQTLHLSSVSPSAVLTCSGDANGKNLPEGKLFGLNGTLIGYDELDGTIPSGREYACILSYQLKTEVAKEPAKPEDAKSLNQDANTGSIGGPTMPSPNDAAETTVRHTMTSDERIEMLTDCVIDLSNQAKIQNSACLALTAGFVVCLVMCIWLLCRVCQLSKDSKKESKKDL